MILLNEIHQLFFMNKYNLILDCNNNMVNIEKLIKLFGVKDSGSFIHYRSDSMILYLDIKEDFKIKISKTMSSSISILFLNNQKYCFNDFEFDDIYSLGDNNDFSTEIYLNNYGLKISSIVSLLKLHGLFNHSIDVSFKITCSKIDDVDYLIDLLNFKYEEEHE